MNSRIRTTLLYAAFAALAILVNLGSQAVVVGTYSGPHAIEASVLVGTACGLLLKYSLDKQHVFEFTSRNLAHDGQLFTLYSVMGLLTTAIFWSTEYAFQWAFHTDMMRYLGGALGLILGYFVKYRLDKRFVFVQSPSASTHT